MLAQEEDDGDGQVAEVIRKVEVDEEAVGRHERVLHADEHGVARACGDKGLHEERDAGKEECRDKKERRGYRFFGVLDCQEQSDEGQEGVDGETDCSPERGVASRAEEELGELVATEEEDEGCENLRRNGFLEAIEDNKR